MTPIYIKGSMSHAESYLNNGTKVEPAEYH